MVCSLLADLANPSPPPAAGNTSEPYSYENSDFSTDHFTDFTESPDIRTEDIPHLASALLNFLDDDELSADGEPPGRSDNEDGSPEVYDIFAEVLKDGPAVKHTKTRNVEDSKDWHPWPSKLVCTYCQLYISSYLTVRHRLAQLTF
jgi:hypothetical protein